MSVAGKGGSAPAPDARGGRTAVTPSQDPSLYQHAGSGGQSGELRPSRLTPGPPDTLGRMGAATTATALSRRQGGGLLLCEHRVSLRPSCRE